MAKLKVQGNASGTGVVTLTAPNTNTDRTITLPDGDITLGGGVDGIVSTANATAITIDANENVGIGTSLPQHLLETSQSSSSKVIGLTLQNSINTNSSTTGVGIKFKGSSYSDADETRKWAGIYGIANDTYHNKMGLSFYTNNDRTQEPTEKLQITSDGRGVSDFTIYCWVNYNGSANSIRDSHNVSSVGDWGTGDFGIYIATGFGNANYAASGASSDSVFLATNTSNTNPQGGRYDFEVKNDAGTAVDRLYNTVMLVGSQ
jgi:hypothetical protein